MDSINPSSQPFPRSSDVSKNQTTSFRNISAMQIQLADLDSGTTPNWPSFQATHSDAPVRFLIYNESININVLNVTGRGTWVEVWVFLTIRRRRNVVVRERGGGFWSFSSSSAYRAIHFRRSLCEAMLILFKFTHWGCLVSCSAPLRTKSTSSLDDRPTRRRMLGPCWFNIMSSLAKKRWRVFSSGCCTTAHARLADISSNHTPSIILYPNFDVSTLYVVHSAIASSLWFGEILSTSYTTSRCCCWYYDIPQRKHTVSQWVNWQPNETSQTL